MDNSDTSLSNEIATMPSPSTKKSSVIRVAQSMDDNDTTIDFLPDKKEGSQDLSNFEIPEPLSAPNSPTTNPNNPLLPSCTVNIGVISVIAQIHYLFHRHLRMQVGRHRINILDDTIVVLFLIVQRNARKIY